MHEFIHYSKNRILYMYQTSFSNVNTNNASSGLRDKVILTNLAPKYDGENRYQNVGQGRRKEPLGGPYLPKKYCMSPS